MQKWHHQYRAIFSQSEKTKKEEFRNLALGRSKTFFSQGARWSWLKMSSKTIKGAIRDVLENLGKKDLDKFRSALLDIREEPRVPVSKVEDQGFLVITDVLVSTYCEDGAARVTLDLLKRIKCFDDAKKLGEVCNI